MAKDAAEGACLCWQSQLQMPLLKQLARLGASLFRLSARSSRSASGIRPGAGLTARLRTHTPLVRNCHSAVCAFCSEEYFRGWQTERELWRPRFYALRVISQYVQEPLVDR